jgi:hypothetical protein
VFQKGGSQQRLEKSKKENYIGLKLGSSQRMEEQRSEGKLKCSIFLSLINLKDNCCLKDRSSHVLDVYSIWIKKGNE